MCKVLDRLETDWAQDNSFPSQIGRAQIEALRTASDPEARFHAKTELVRNLYRSGYNAGEVRELFRLIDWMMHLRLDLSRRFDADLIAYEKELQMPYVTSIERNAEERGLKKGLEQGLEQGFAKGRQEASIGLVLEQLLRFCGVLPLEVEHQLRQLPLNQILRLIRSQFDFKSLADLQIWLQLVAD